MICICCVWYEIEHQAAWVYERYDLASVCPDSTHNLHKGYITKPDIDEIIKAGGGSLPRMRYLFHLVRHTYPSGIDSL